MPPDLLHNMMTAPREEALVRPAALESALVRFRLPALPQAEMRDIIEAETRRLGLRGCALVRAERPGDVVTDACEMLSLIVLSKSSDRIFLAAKTPLLDAQTLSRTLVSADPRLRFKP